MRRAPASRFHRVGGPQPAPGPDPNAPPPSGTPGASASPPASPQPAPGPDPTGQGPAQPSGGFDPFGIGAALQTGTAGAIAVGQIGLGAVMIAVAVLIVMAQTGAGGQVARGVSRVARKAALGAVTGGAGALA